MLLLSFFLLLGLSMAYSVYAGGNRARIAVGMMAFSTVASRFAALQSQYQIGLAIVDLALFIGLASLSMRGKSFWTMWVAGFQGAAVATHLAAFIAPPLDYKIYHAINGFWAVPILLVMPWGIYRDRRAAKQAP